jgi:argininosuccinate lyase
MELGDGVTSGSSLMPQKKNPDSLELIRGKCGRVIGALNSLMITMKGLPMTYNRDMQEDKEPLFEAADQLTGCLEMAREVASTVVLNPQAPLNDTEESWVVATDLAEALARGGIPFHQAHKLVGRLVLESVRAGKDPQEWNAESLQAFTPEFTPEIAQRLAKLLDPREGMKSREIPGGTGPAHVDAMLKARRALLEAMRK